MMRGFATILIIFCIAGPKALAEDGQLNLYLVHSDFCKTVQERLFLAGYAMASEDDLCVTPQNEQDIVLAAFESREAKYAWAVNSIDMNTLTTRAFQAVVPDIG